MNEDLRILYCEEEHIMRLMKLPIKDVLLYARRFREISNSTAIEKLKDLYALIGDDLEWAKLINLAAFYWFNQGNKPFKYDFPKPDLPDGDTMWLDWEENIRLIGSLVSKGHDRETLIAVSAGSIGRFNKTNWKYRLERISDDELNDFAWLFAGKNTIFAEERVRIYNKRKHDYSESEVDHLRKLNERFAELTGEMFVRLEKIIASSKEAVSEGMTNEGTVVIKASFYFEGTTDFTKPHCIQFSPNPLEAIINVSGVGITYVFSKDEDKAYYLFSEEYGNPDGILETPQKQIPFEVLHNQYSTYSPTIQSAGLVERIAEKYGIEGYVNSYDKLNDDIISLQKRIGTNLNYFFKKMFYDGLLTLGDALKISADRLWYKFDIQLN